LASAARQFFWINLFKYFRKKYIIWGEKTKLEKLLDKNLNFFSNFGSNFQADFGYPCDYYKSVTKILEIFMTPLFFFKKGNPSQLLY